MQQQFPALTSWDAYPRIGIGAFLERFPDVADREEAFEDEIDDPGRLRDWHADTQLVLIEGDIAITDAQFAQLEGGSDVLLVVDGSVELEGSHHRLLYASGDLFCDILDQESLHMQYPVGGHVVARLYARLRAEDDGRVLPAAAIRLDTPFVFSWYYQVDELGLAPETVIFLIDDGEYAAALDLPNPLFHYHDCVFVLRPDLVEDAPCRSANRAAWKIEAIEAALLRGESMFIDGFTLACLPAMRLAETAVGERAWSLAFAQFQAAAALSPRYYEAWMGMGRALLGAGAFAQAIPLYRRASDLFPPHQTGLCNEGANAAAACALVCGELDVAIELATLSIDHLRESMYDRELLAQGFRLRAEARLRSGELEEARADLASQLRYWPNQASAHWLMGLYHYKRGEQAQALAAHALAVAEAARLAPFYDEADCLNFLYKQPVIVDWDGVSIDAARP